jgi:alpha-ketoglutarate-dependent taurine dioxygenase
MGATDVAKLKTEKLTPTVGAEVLDADVDRLLNDETVPGAVHDALEEHGVLLFRELDISDDDQVAFCRRLGEPAIEMMEVSLKPENPLADALQGIVEWHMDGTQDPIPALATVISARVVADRGGETEFASTYHAYDSLSDEEKERYAKLRVFHTFAAAQRSTHPDPSPETLADWERRGGKEHPLVWSHRSGRKSLVIGSSADWVIGMDPDESRQLLDDLIARATTPDRVYRHSWSVGDMVMWDNRGMLHRVQAFDKRSGREMHRTTLAGDEPIQ